MTTAGNETIRRLLQMMQPGWTLESMYSGGGRQNFHWSFMGATKSEESAAAQEATRDFQAGLQLYLRRFATDFRFQQVQPIKAPDYNWVGFARMPSLDFTVQGHGAGFQTSTAHQPAKTIHLPKLSPPSENTVAPNRLPELLEHLSTPVTIRISLTRVELDDALYERMEELIRHAENNPTRFHAIDSTTASAQMLASVSTQYFRTWLLHGRGYSWSLQVAAEQRPPDTILRSLCTELIPWSGGNMEFQNAKEGSSQTDRAHIKQSLDLLQLLPDDIMYPSLFPATEAMGSSAATRMYRSKPLPRTDGDYLLGYVADGEGNTPVHMSERDRARHIFILGSTGSGKSTLMANLIAQDIASGSGCCVIDPHGDLITQVMSHIPPSRYQDIIVFAPGDRHWATGINYLECFSQYRDKETHFLINELILICRRLFSDEMTGPVFEQYLRTALLVLMDNASIQAKLTDLLELFQDSEFRNAILSSSTNEHAVQFWKNTATKTSGDISLTNVTSYIISKFNAQPSHRGLQKGRGLIIETS